MLKNFIIKNIKFYLIVFLLTAITLYIIHYKMNQRIFISTSLIDDENLVIIKQFSDIINISEQFSGYTDYKYSCKNLNQVKSMFISSDFEIPIIFRTCKHSFNYKNAPIAIWLHGGPFVSSQSKTTPEQDLFLQNGYIIAEIQYLGSAERPWIHSIPNFSAKSFLDTRRELIELGRFYKETGRKITYAGDSFGGKIISSMLGHMDQSDNVVMLSPYLQSVKSDLRFSDAHITKPSEKWLFQIVCRLTAVIECNDPDAWLEKNIFRSYYEFTPVRDFRGLKLKPKIYIVSGADDKRVGVEPAKAFTAAFSTSTKHLIIPNLGHESPKNIEQFEEIERFLAPVLSLGSKQ